MAVEADEMAARLRAELPGALRSGQLVPYYQPEVELSSGRVVAAESLARWEHPEYGTLPPALFTPLAENLGLMGELTQLMLRQSLAQHRTWAAAGWVVPVSVNVGPDCVIDPAFPDVIAEFLRSEQVPGPMLALEVSEQTGTTAVSSVSSPSWPSSASGSPSMTSAPASPRWKASAAGPWTSSSSTCPWSAPSPATRASGRSSALPSTSLTNSA